MLPILTVDVANQPIIEDAKTKQRQKDASMQQHLFWF